MQSFKSYFSIISDKIRLLHTKGQPCQIQKNSKTF